MKGNIPAPWWRKRNFARHTDSNSWRTLPRAMEPDDVKRLLRKRFTPRDKCMILMLLRSGMRISESLALKLEDINLRKRTVTIRESAKTGNARITYLSDDAYKALRKWMKARKANTKFLNYCISSCLSDIQRYRRQWNGPNYMPHCLYHAFLRSCRQLPHNEMLPKAASP
jgi:integrase